MGDGKLMIINKTGITSQTHEAMRVWLDETHGLHLMGSSVLWIQVDREVSDDELASIMGLDVSTLAVTPRPPTQAELLAQLNLELELQAEAMSEMMEVLSVL